MNRRSFIKAALVAGVAGLSREAFAVPAVHYHTAASLFDDDPFFMVPGGNACWLNQDRTVYFVPAWNGKLPPFVPFSAEGRTASEAQDGVDRQVEEAAARLLFVAGGLHELDHGGSAAAAMRRLRNHFAPDEVLFVRYENYLIGGNNYYRNKFVIRDGTLPPTFEDGLLTQKIALAVTDHHAVAICRT